VYDTNNKIFIIAGETSGDIHAALLVKNILKRKDNVSFYGIGGRNLANNGVELIFDYKDVNFIGFVSILKNIFQLKRIFSATINKILEINPEVIVLVDFPGFNLRIIKKLKKYYKGKIIYYISPQLWAWHKSRIKLIKECVNRMLVVFPFEVEFYEKEGVKADFVGHPLKDKVLNFLNNNAKEKRNRTRITLLPGSRIEEVIKILPIMSDAALRLKDTFSADLFILCSENIDVNLIKEIVNESSFSIIRKKDESDEENYKALLNSDLVITKSGTSTLECCLIGAPFCLVYNTNIINYLLGKFLIKVKYLSIVNILAGKKIVEEFIQKDFTIDNIYSEGYKIITNNKYTEYMKKNFEDVRENLFNTNISTKAEEIICEYLK
jgi:lipid-A-disaccharide synthase